MIFSATSLSRIHRPIRVALRSDFLRHGALVFGSTMLVNLSSYFFHFFALRRMSVAEYGGLSALIAVLGIMSGPAAILSTVVVKYSADLHALGEDGKLAYLFRRLVRGTAITCAIIVLAALVFQHAATAYLQLNQPLSEVLVAFLVGLSFCVSGTRSILQGTQHFGSFAISATLEGIGRATLAIALLYAGFGIAGALGGFVIASVLSLAYNVL